jgi:hypothetical protein
MTCAIRIGRLIAHPCGRGGTTPCARCQAFVCARHLDAQRVCAVCSGTWVAPTASVDIDEFGDPLQFTPEIFRAFQRRAAAPDDELSGVDS